MTLSNEQFRWKRSKLRKQDNVRGHAVNISTNVWKLYISKTNLVDEPQPLACHGATILAISKLILMEGINFLLKHLRPDQAQLLYLDTDSMHLAISNPVFENNVASHMKKSFNMKKYYFLDEQSAPSGMLVIESIVDYEQIFSEKFYVLKKKDQQNSHKYVFDSNIKSLACRGIPQRILNNSQDKIESLNPTYGYQESAICRMGPNQGVSNSVRYKILGALMVPSRRFFLDHNNSIPFTFSTSYEGNISQNKIEDNRHYLYQRLTSKKKRKKSKSTSSSRDPTFTNVNEEYQSNHSGILSQLFAMDDRSSRDIIDEAYKASLPDSNVDNDEVYAPPKKRKKHMFIDYESKC